MESPLVFIIFGATGDLMARKLMPAMYLLCKKGEMSKHVFIIGVGRRKITDDQFRELMAIAVKDRAGDAFDLRLWNDLVDRIEYQQGYFEDAALYEKLVVRLKRFDQLTAACVPRFFYLATPPQHYETILTHLKTSTLSEGCGQGTTNFTRVLIEKPFGRDLSTARSLDKLLASIFEEKQIYRIDHYLGKETVQNILAFRFANGIFEPTWNAGFIDHIQMTLAEDVGVGSRGEFYDGVGALRDVVQNHML
ncbi:glucose-6-phosphate dehydrogenase, partial [Candidatus Gottesmanbacteria bacterium]|nr:glucose-6-phosphate dehydrogenase [Candidatus Gottesmanbacteria bacterium]